jgi:peptide/nickel transport system permease protein
MTVAANTAIAAEQPARFGRATNFLRYVRRNPSLGVGLVLFISLILFATAGRLVIDVSKQAYPLAGPASKPPSAQYPFGTDAQGRNLFAVMVAGTGQTLRIGLTAAVLSILLGTIVGFVSAYYGGMIDTILRWIIDVLLTIPNLIILVVVASILKRFLSVEILALIIASLAWVGPARTIRSQVLTLRERQFVQMARLSGMSGPEIIFRELLPNLLPFLLASFVTILIGAIGASLGLELLGLGSQREPTLGMTLYWVQRYSAILRGLWWWWGIPIMMIIILITSLALISIGLDEWSNPRVRRSE